MQWFSGWVLLGTTPCNFEKKLCVLVTIQMLTLLAVPCQHFHGRWGGSKLKLEIFVSLQMKEGWFRPQYSKEAGDVFKHFGWGHSYDRESMCIYTETGQNRVMDPGTTSLSLYGVQYPWRWTSVGTEINNYRQANTTSWSRRNESSRYQLNNEFCPRVIK